MTRPAPGPHGHRWAARAGAVATTTLLFVAGSAHAAAAAPRDDTDLGQTPPALAWIHLLDSRGIPLWNYELSLDRGGVFSPDKFFWSAITDVCWGAYRSWCALALWFLDWVLSFEWLRTIAEPLLATGDAMQSIVDRIGAVPVLLTVTAVIAVCWMARGRYATGIWELGTALVIAALASGVFAQPVQLVAGDNGLIMKTQRAGLELSSALVTDGQDTSQTADQMRKLQTGQLVDTFIRQPTEMINFGGVLDGGKCEKAYNEVLKDGPYGTEPDIRNKVGDCDPGLGDYAGHPSASMALGSIVFMPASFVILLLTIVLAGSVIAAGCHAMFQAVKAIVTLVTGLLPGGARGSLLLTIAEVAISLLIILFTTVFLSVFLLVIQAMFRAGSGDSVPKTFVIVDVILIVGVFIYWRQRKRLKETAKRLAEWMSQRPGTGVRATRLPERPGSGLGSAAGSVVRTATSLAQLRASRAVLKRAPGATYHIDARRQAAFIGVPGQPGDGPDLPFYPSETGPGPGSGGPRGSGGGPRTPLPGPATGPRRLESTKRKAVGGLVRAGTNTALAYATGGASTVVTGSMTAARTGRAVNSARRAALASRLALPAGRPAPQPPMPTRTQPARVAGRGRRDADPVLRATVVPASSTTPGGEVGKTQATGGPVVPAVRARRSPASPAPLTSRAPQGDPDPARARTPRQLTAGEERPPGPQRQWDKVIRDGVVVLVPKGNAADPGAPPAIARKRRRGPRGR